MLEGGGRARDSVCRRCVHYQEPDTELFTNTVSYTSDTIELTRAN